MRQLEKKSHQERKEMSSCLSATTEEACRYKYPLCNWGPKRGCYLATTSGDCPLHPTGRSTKGFKALSAANQARHSARSVDTLVGEYVKPYYPGGFQCPRQVAEELLNIYRAHQQKRRQDRKLYIPARSRVFDEKTLRLLANSVDEKFNRVLSNSNMRDVMERGVQVLKREEKKASHDPEEKLRSRNSSSSRPFISELLFRLPGEDYVPRPSRKENKQIRDYCRQLNTPDECAILGEYCQWQDDMCTSTGRRFEDYHPDIISSILQARQ